MLEAVQELGEDAAKLAASSLWSLSDADVTACLQAAHRVEQAAAVLQARLAQQAGVRGLPSAQGHRSMAAWLRSLLRVDPQPAREVAEAAAVLGREPGVEQAAIDGLVDLRQAAVIAASVQDVRAGVADDDRVGLAEAATVAQAAESALVEMAGRLPAFQLRRVGERILAHVAPDLADRAERALLERQEARAYARRHLTLSLPVNGMVRLSGILGVEDAAVVHAAVLPLCGPSAATGFAADAAAAVDVGAAAGPVYAAAGPAAEAVGVIVGAAPVAGGAAVTDAGPAAGTASSATDIGARAAAAVVDDRTAGQRRADALVEICRLALRTGRLPDDGGRPPQLAVTVAYDPLTRTLGAATTDTGQRLSAGTARRLACDARILPVVLAGNSQILDAGRTRRLVTGTLRKALHIRDQGCAFPDCDRPPRWTDAHHVVDWMAGGPTDLDNLVLLCRHHHRLIHHPTAGWQIRIAADRRPDFIPPPNVDPTRTPRRNMYHPRI